MTQIISMPMRPSNAQKLLREWTQDTVRVIFMRHAKERMRTGYITAVQVYRCLRQGTVVEGPSMAVRGGWKLDVQVQSSGNALRVAAELNLTEEIIVITVYD